MDADKSEEMRPREASISSIEELDPKEERRVLRKVDMVIVPLVMLVYLLSFLDRVNIGNARLYGMEEDLGLEGNQFQLAVSIMFIPYCLLEVPSNLVLKKFRPSRFLASVTIAWGLVCTFTGLTQNFGGLAATRVLLGAAESPLFPCMVTYLTIFYNRRELALRTGFLFTSAAIASALGGLLAYAIGFMDGIQGMRGWRWIYIIEGIPSVVMGVFMFFIMPDDPETCWFLKPAERRVMYLRRRRETGMTDSAKEFHWKDVKDGATDWKLLALCFAQFGVDTMLYSYSVFLATMIKEMGDWNVAETQLLTIPCFALGAIVYLSFAWLSDRYQLRAPFAIAFGIVSIIGYGILLADVAAGVHYFACCLIACGLYVVVGLPLAWLPSNTPRYGKRTFASGLQLTMGNFSGIMAPFLYKTNEAPRFVRGHAVNIGMIFYSCITFAVVFFWLLRKNRLRRNNVRSKKLEGLSEAEIEELGDHNPRFIYTL